MRDSWSSIGSQINLWSPAADQPEAYNGSHANRLLNYRIESPGAPDEDVWYYYDADGNVIRIVRKTESDSFYTATRLIYNDGGQVEFVVGEQWDQAEDTPTGDLDWKEVTSLSGELALTPTPMTWQQARDYAISRGGDLVSIPFGAQPNLADAFDPGSGYPESYWVGAIQDPLGDEPAGDWGWVDESPNFLGEWLSGEPDDGGGGTCPQIPTNCLDHDVATLTFPAAGTHGLADDDATALRYGIIQRPTAAACDPLADTARNFARTFAWQFRYDDPRGRYMRRMLDPDTLAEVLTDWTVYEGNNAISDFIDDGSTGDTQRHYFGSTVHADVDTNGDWDSEAWFFRNQIGSTELARGATSLESLHLAYTAFGEEYDLTTGVGVNTRYRYAGAWGYQSHDNFQFQHVGVRWYDPETGRFMQRDPIGVKGGVNVYAYVKNLPTKNVDPFGLMPSAARDQMIIDNPPNIPGPGKGSGNEKSPQEELDDINRKLNRWAAGFAGCAAVTAKFCPIVGGALGVASAACWASSTIY